MVRLTTAFIAVILAAATASALPAPNHVMIALSDGAEYNALDLEVLRVAQILAGNTLYAGEHSAAFVKRSPQSDSSGGGGGAGHDSSGGGGGGGHDSSGGGGGGSGSDGSSDGVWEFPWWLANSPGGSDSS